MGEGGDDAVLDPRITLAGLRQLAALGDHASLSAVARHLGVSQPTVSSNLARLEDVMGFPLLLRGTRGSTLTNEGAVAVAAARAVIAAADEFARTVEGLPELTLAPLRVAASLTIAEQLVPRWLADSRIAGHIAPGQATLKVGNSDAVMRLVENDDADIGFVEGNRFREGVAHTSIGSDELVVVVGPAHPWFVPRPRIAATDLVRSALVLRERGSGTLEVIQDALAQVGVSLPRHSPSFGSTAAILTAVRHGDAVAVVSRLAVQHDVDAGGLVIIDVADVAFVRNLSAVWRAGALQRADAVELVTNVANARGAAAGMS